MGGCYIHPCLESQRLSCRLQDNTARSFPFSFFRSLPLAASCQETARTKSSYLHNPCSSWKEATTDDTAVNPLSLTHATPQPPCLPTWTLRLSHHATQALEAETPFHPQPASSTLASATLSALAPGMLTAMDTFPRWTRRGAVCFPLERRARRICPGWPHLHRGPMVVQLQRARVVRVQQDHPTLRRIHVLVPHPVQEQAPTPPAGANPSAPHPPVH